MTATCPQCTTANDDGAKFCVECGATLAALTCVSCGTPASRGKFCAECGAALVAARDGIGPAAQVGGFGAPPSGDLLEQRVVERRIASVLFADLVGFTTLSESRDPEEVRELLSRYFDAARSVVARYGGTIEKFIGDAVMAVWGVPTSHGDDAERAVRAGLDLVDRVLGLADEVAIPDLSMRVGVVTGEVAVTLGAEGQGMVAGDIVNTAARVQAIAEPGSVWVDESTRSLTAAAVAYADAGEHQLKGKSSPLPLHRARAVVASVGGAQRVDGLEAPFTGRDREMRFVKELFEATEEDGRSRLVVVSGVAGTGKSRLGWEFEKYADGLRRFVRWHRGRCLSYGEGVAFWALTEMVRGRLGLSETDPQSAVVDKLDAWLDEFVAADSERQRLRPLLSILLGIDGGSFSREDMFAGWTGFFEALSTDGEAVVLLVEDLQYADDGLLDFLEHALQTARFPLFVLGLARTELAERRPGFGVGRRATTIQLEPLSDRAMEALVDGLVDGLPETARHVLIERAEGIPLYAVETVRLLIDQDVVIPRHGRYVLADDAKTRVDLNNLGAPASLQALVSSRLDALESAERALVQDAAVLGLSFSVEALAALGSASESELHTLLAPLVRKEIVELQTDPYSAERGQYRFVQAVVRQVAYETLSHRDRKARHLAVARHLSTWSDPGDDLAAVIAQHILDAIAQSASDDTDTNSLAGEAQVLLERAAKRSLALGSPAEAYRHYVSALGLPIDEVLGARLDEGAARAAVAQGEPAVALDHAMRAVAAHDTAGRLVDAARAATITGQAMILQQDMARAIHELTPRYEVLTTRTDADMVLLELAETIGRAHNYLGDVVAARRYIERMLLLAEAAGDQESIVKALTHWSNIWIVVGIPTDGLAVLKRSVELARESQRPTTLLQPLIHTSAFLSTRDLPLALDAAQEGLRLARQTGHAPQAGIAAANVAAGLWGLGRWPELRAHLEEMEHEQIVPSMLCSLIAIRAWLAVATGSQPDDVLPEAIAALENADDLQSRAWALTAHAAILTRQDQQAQRANLTLEASRAALEWGGTDDDFVHHWAVAIEACVAAGNIGDARTALQMVEARPHGLIAPYVRAELHRLRGLAELDHGDPAAVEADLLAAIDGHSQVGLPFRLAQAQLSLGRLFLRLDRVDEATSAMTAARAGFETLGATPWVVRAETQELTGV